MPAQNTYGDVECIRLGRLTRPSRLVLLLFVVGCGGNSAPPNPGPFAGRWSCTASQLSVVGTSTVASSGSTTLVITNNADGTITVTDSGGLTCPITYSTSGDSATGETRSCTIGSLPVTITSATLTVSGRSFIDDVEMTTPDTLNGTGTLSVNYSCSM